VEQSVAGCYPVIVAVHIQRKTENETFFALISRKITFIVFEMAALRKIGLLGIHIMDKVRVENIRRALDLTDTIVQKVHERQHRWIGHSPNG